VSVRITRRGSGRRALALAAAVATALGAGVLPAAADTEAPPADTGGTASTQGAVEGADWAYAPTTASLGQVAAAIGADRLWERGVTGKGVGVALIDTGVAPVPGLSSGNVVNGPDLSFDSQVEDRRDLDGYGHGTHWAGIIAGNDGVAQRGIAPEATLLSVRVGASDGAVDVTQLIAAIDWVVAHRADPGLNIRVLNLSGGTDGVQDYRLDPLTHAIENAWRAGIVVVSAAGNRGEEGLGALDNPARDPFVVAVGAADTHGTIPAYDDTVPAFSSRGSADRPIDVVAPGQSILSLRDPGSTIDERFPEARVGEHMFKGSGTSQAAAVVSGAAALLLQQRPELTPDQVKALLSETAAPLPRADAAGSGHGLVDVAAAAAAAAPASAAQSWEPSTGLGSLEAARGTSHVADGDVELTGEQDIFGHAWTPGVWAPASAAGTAWDGGTWNGSAWTGECWCGSSWTGDVWTNRTWSNRTWSNRTWSNRTWSNRTWSNRTWSNRTWSVGTWSTELAPNTADGDG
jgi:serine protease AprX